MPSAFSLGLERGPKPRGRVVGDLRERAGLLEQVSRARHDLDRHLARHAGPRLLVQHQHRIVIATDNQHGRRFDAQQRAVGEIGTAAARDDPFHETRPIGGGNGRRRGSGARPENTDGQLLERRLRRGPVDRRDQALREQV